MLGRGTRLSVRIEVHLVLMHDEVKRPRTSSSHVVIAIWEVELGHGVRWRQLNLAEASGALSTVYASDLSGGGGEYGRKEGRAKGVRFGGNYLCTRALGREKPR
jgi:hypothetical protein